MSQRLNILRALASGAMLTPLDALKKFDCLTLSQRVTELKEQGWPIVSRMVRVGRKRVARYSIPAARLAAISKRKLA